MALDASPPLRGRLAAPSLFSQLGRDWRSLEESMPSPCQRQNSGAYAVRHNPAAYYTRLLPSCAARDIPLANPPDLSVTQANAPGGWCRRTASQFRTLSIWMNTMESGGVRAKILKSANNRRLNEKRTCQDMMRCGGVNIFAECWRKSNG